jgi:hypothetical protein
MKKYAKQTHMKNIPNRGYVYNLDDNINSFLYGGEKGKHVYKFD